MSEEHGPYFGSIKDSSGFVHSVELSLKQDFVSVSGKRKCGVTVKPLKPEDHSSNSV